MKLLLDTHILLWWLEDDPRLSKADRERIADTAHEICVSVASAYEVSLKAMLGKIDWDIDALAVAIAQEGFQILPLTWRHLSHAGRFPRHPNKDPWDRIIVAQALLERIPLVTADRDVNTLYKQARKQLDLPA